MEGILLRILWVFGRGMSYWLVYRGWPGYRWPVWEGSLYFYQGMDAVPHCVLVNGHSVHPCGSLSHLVCMYTVLIGYFFLVYLSLLPS